MTNRHLWRLLFSYFVVIRALLRNVARWTDWCFGLNPWGRVCIRGVLIDVLERVIWLSLSIVWCLDGLVPAGEILGRIYSIFNVSSINERWRMGLTCSCTAACCILLSFRLRQLLVGSINRCSFPTSIFWWWHYLVLSLLSVACAVCFLFSCRLLLLLQLRRAVLLLLPKFMAFFLLKIFKHAGCPFVRYFDISQVFHFHGLHDFLGQVTDACLLLTFMFIIVQSLIHRLI